MTSLATDHLSVSLERDSFTLDSAACSWRGVKLTVKTSLGDAIVSDLQIESQEGDSEEGLDVRLSGSCRFGRVRFRLGISATEPVALLWLDFAASEALQFHSMTLQGEIVGLFDRFWKQGWQSWSPAYVTPLAGADDSPVDRLLAGFADLTGVRSSFDVGLLAGPRSAICAGFLTADRFLGALTLHENLLTCSWLAAGVTVEPGETLSLEVLRVELSDDPNGALDRYAAAVAELAATSPPDVAPSGWCSWYYYYAAVTEADLLSNLDFLAAHKRELPVGFVQLDDGYQADIGDWRDWNEKFPGGPKAITTRIHEAGLDAGLWIAPFLAGENSQLARDHPDWLVRDSSDQPVVAVRNWDQANYALDLTHPQVQDWLSGLFVEIFDDWAFDYVKIDFVFAGALPGSRWNKRQTPLEAYREGLAIIRRAAGERFVLGCGALQLASVGLVDAMRIGPDVAPWWRARGPRGTDGVPAELPRINGAPAAEAAIRNTLQRQWSHGKLWLNDPDCVLARDSETKLTAAEIQSLATVVSLSGGMIVLSDNLPALSAAALRTLSFLLPPLATAATVRNALDSDLPDRLELDAGQRLVVALFNWDDAERDLTLRVTEAEVFDVWNEQHLGVARGQLVLPAVPAHGCRLLALSPPGDSPCLLASSFHIGQGLNEVESETYDPDDRVLVVRLNPVAIRTGALWLRWPFASLEVEGSYNSVDSRDGIVRIDLTLDAPAELVLRPQQARA